MSSNQTHLTYTTNKKERKKRKTLLPQIPFCNPPKKSPIFITSLSLKRNNYVVLYFPEFMWAFWALSWSELHRENRKPRHPSHLSLSSLSFCPLSSFIISCPPLFFLPSPYLSLSLPLSILFHIFSLSFSLSLYFLSL